MTARLWSYREILSPGWLWQGHAQKRSGPTLGAFSSRADGENQHLEIHFLKTYYWLHLGPATADWMCTQPRQMVPAAAERCGLILIQTLPFREEHNPSILRRVQCPWGDTSWWTAHAHLTWSLTGPHQWIRGTNKKEHLWKARESSSQNLRAAEKLGGLVGLAEESSPLHDSSWLPAPDSWFPPSTIWLCSVCSSEQRDRTLRKDVSSVLQWSSKPRIFPCFLRQCAGPSLTRSPEGSMFDVK